MIEVLLALFASFGSSIGGKTGALIGQLASTFGTVKMDLARFESEVVPWIRWANAIADANRNPTAEEEAAANAVADAAHADLQSKARGGPPVPIPAPPAA